MGPWNRHILQSDVWLLIPAKKDCLGLALLAMNTVNHPPLLELSTPLIELQSLQNKGILVNFYGDEFKHVSLGADELRQLWFADLASLLLEGVDSDALPVLFDYSIVHPPAETTDMHVGQTTSAVTGWNQKILMIEGLFT